MEFSEKIAQLKERAEKLKDSLSSEEATKNALIMPFINSLGYDVFNPLEVVPEFVPDKGFKKDERVDYAILKEGKPIILIECKRVENSKLDIKKHGSQLFKYFTASKAKFIIFTNGIVYKFFSDIEETNILDKEPFFTFNIIEFKESQISNLQNFCKETFDIDKAFSNAGDLKYIRSFENVIENEYKNPSDDFVKYMLDKSGIYDGIKTAKVIEKHKKTTIEAFNLFMSKVMKTSLDFGHINKTEEKENKEVTDSKKEITTTIEELEGYAIIKAMVNGHLDINRITYKDTVSYFNVTLDNNILKTVCRLYLNKQNKCISFLSKSKESTKKSSDEEKIQINSINELFNFKDRILSKIQEIDTNYVKK